LEEDAQLHRLFPEREFWRVILGYSGVEENEGEGKAASKPLRVMLPEGHVQFASPAYGSHLLREKG